MSGLNQRIEVLCSDQQHPIQARLRTWCEQQDARLCGRVDELLGGDFLFLVSCQSIVSTQLRARYRYCLVVHASDLPTGRGMSPQVWQVISGAKHITVTLLNADDPVDSGDIWQQRGFELQGHELYDEINAKLFDAEFELLDWALEHCVHSQPRIQQGEPSHYPRRCREDSRINPEESIASQFDLLRVADTERYPAFFDLRGYRYEVVLKKVGKSI